MAENGNISLTIDNQRAVRLQIIKQVFEASSHLPENFYQTLFVRAFRCLDFTLQPHKVLKPSAPTTLTEQRIAALAGILNSIEQELKDLTGGQIDLTTVEDGVPFLLRDAQERLGLQESTRRQAAEMQMAILNALPAQIALLDSQGVVLAVNESWRQYATANAMQREDFFVGRNYLNVCDSAEGECAQESHAAAQGIRAVLAGRRKEFTLEYPCHTPSEKRWFRLMVTPLNEGHQAGVVVMHVNVTERLRAEEILRENQQRLEREAARLHESQLVASIGSWETDLSTLEVVWTEQTHRIFETSPDHFIPSHQPILDHVHPDDRAEVNEIFLQSINQAGSFALEHRLLMPDGRIKFVDERWRIFHDEKGRPFRALGTCQDITERKQAADSLAQGQMLLRFAGQAARLGGWSLTIPDNQLTWSDEICLIHDMPVGSVPTLEEAIMFYSPEHRDEVARLLKLCVEEGKPFDFEMELVTARQRRIWVRAIGEAMRDEKGRIYRLQGAFQDISRQKAAEEAARCAGERLLDTVESITDGFFTLDREWHFTYVNAEAERLLECPRDSLLGFTIWEAFPPVVGMVFEREYRWAMAENRTTTFEEFYPPLDMWIEVKAYPSAEGLAVYFRDVSERHHTLTALRASEASLIRAQSIARIGNWDWDIVSDELYWSAQVFQLFGLDPDTPETTYKRFLNSLHPEDREQTHQAVMASVAGTATYNVEHRVQWPDGSVRVMHEQGVVIRDADGKALKMTGTVQDITERKLTEMALAQKTRALTLLIRCNEALIRSETEMELLTGICQTAVDVGGFPLAWVGYALDDPSKTVMPQAYAGVEDGYLAKATISWDANRPTGQGPAGKTIRGGVPTVVPNLEIDENFQPWLEALRARGFRGVISLPLKDASRTFGVLILYLPEVRHPQPDELHVLQELADDMAFGIVNIRDRHTRQRIHTALVNVATAVSATTGIQFFEKLADNMAQTLGAQASFVAQCVPGVPLRARTIAAVVDGQPVGSFDYVLEGTPCENLIDSDTCIISAEVAQQFPSAPRLAALGAQSYVGRRLDSSTGKFLGLLFVLYREPLREPDIVVATLQIFAARAASELERQETDARVREQAALLDKARDAIFVRDLDHHILYWNQSAERLYGWSAAEALGRSVFELIHREIGPFEAALEQVMASGEWAGEMAQVTKEGRGVIVEGHYSLVCDELGKPHSILSINTDITERKMIELQNLRTQRMDSIGTLAGGIAHDLNNVLTPIIMGIELLKSEEKSPQCLDLLATMEGSAHRGADMVRQVLSFARGVESQQLEVQVGLLIKEIEKIVRDTFFKNIEVSSSIPLDLWLVQGDPTQLHQVLLNLCVNARDAMPCGGILKLTASSIMFDEQYAGMNIEAKPGPHVCIEVEDSGTGMPPDVIEHIFEPFFTTKKLGEGTGLGLSTSIAIIKSHGGFIQTYSEEGNGTSFRVYLPAYTKSNKVESNLAPSELPRGNGELVLVVDDELAVRQITQQTLEAFGYRVVVASDGIEATSIYAAKYQEIAIVLTDMMMPMMDGTNTIQVLMRLNPQVRIIASSGLKTNAMVAKTTSAGVKHFLPKPYTANALLQTLREVLDV